MALTHRSRLAATLVLALAALAGLLLLRPELVRARAGFVIVSGRSMEPALAGGDLVLALERPSYQVGDVIAFRVPDGHPGSGAHIIHRIVGGSPESGFVTRGDNTQAADSWRPRPTDVVGKMQVRVPRLGLVLDVVRRPLGLATAAALTALLLLVRRRRG